MSIKIVDTSFGRDTSSNRLVRTARVDIAQPHAPARPTVLQVVIRHDDVRRKSKAAVKVLTDQLTWTEILVPEVGDCTKVCRRSGPVTARPKNS